MRLLSLSNDDVSEMLKQMDSEASSIKSEVFKVVWYMRGGVNLDQAFMLTQKEFSIISKIVKDNIDITKKTGMPLI